MLVAVTMDKLGQLPLKIINLIDNISNNSGLLFKKVLNKTKILINLFHLLIHRKDTNKFLLIVTIMLMHLFKGIKERFQNQLKIFNSLSTQIQREITLLTKRMIFKLLMMMEINVWIYRQDKNQIYKRKNQIIKTLRFKN